LIRETIELVAQRMEAVLAGQLVNRLADDLAADPRQARPL